MYCQWIRGINVTFACQGKDRDNANFKMMATLN